ncbi:MAG: flagellar hook-length control protein FliK [Lachnospiraceae bacterium]|nr:flagellar hook-length control protein FliK [Lachnospiraceae bacterium]
MTSTPVTGAAAFIAPASNTNAQGNLPGKGEAGAAKGLSFSDTMMQQTNLSALSTAATRSNAPISDPTAKTAEVKPQNTEKPVKNGEEEKKAPQDVAKADKTQQTDETGKTKDPKTETAEETADTEETLQIPEEEISEEAVAEVLEAITTSLITDIAQVLNVSEEEVTQAISDLEMTGADLLTQEGITKLALVLTGNTEPSAMLTNEELYGQVQQLIGDAVEITEEAVQETPFTEKDILAYAAQIREEALPKEEMVPETDEDPVRPEITVETRKPQIILNDSRQTKVQVKLETGDAPQVTVVTGKDNTAKDNAASGENGGMFFGQSEQTVTVQTEAVAEAPVPTYVPTTEEIMNQVMDYMRINLTPDVNELSMQLNPESLGTIHVQIVEKNGTISAQFHTTNEAVKQALETQMVVLKQDFEEQGIKVDAIQVTVNDSDFERDLQQGFGQNNQQAGRDEQNAPRRVRRIQLGEDGLFAEDLDEEDRIQAEMMAANGNSVDFQA